MIFKKFTSLENTYRQNLIDKIQYEGKDGGEWIATEKIHGCFQDKTKITLPDGSYKSIKEIVESRYSGEVLGVDKYGKLVPTKVVNWYNNGNTTEWLKVTFQTYGGKGGNSRVVKCTPNHKFFSDGEYIPMEKLKIGDSVEFTYSGCSLSFIQKQVLIGKMLGDGSLSNSSVAFGHKDSHEDYTDFTLKCLGSLAGNRQANTTSGYGTTISRGRSISTEEIDELFNLWDKSLGIVPKVNLTPISLAFWYLDDGSISLNDSQRPRASFATCGFTKESCLNLRESLKDLGIESEVTGKDGRLRITLSADSTDLLFSYICNLVPESMQYKLPPEFRIKGSGIGFVEQAAHDFASRKSYAIIKNIEQIKEDKQRYDIETETHNYFANNLHVHNCNFSFWCDGNEVRVASRSQFVDGTFYNCQSVINKYSEGVLALCNENNLTDVVIYGELFGKGVQKEVEYGERDFRAFDVVINGNPITKTDAIEFTHDCGIQFVPVIHKGTFSECLKLNNTFKSILTPFDYEGENISEGLVIEPIIPNWFNNGSRIYFKNKTDSFSEKKRQPKGQQVFELSEKESNLLNDLLEYNTEQRVSNVISKFGAVTSKDFGSILGMTVQDILEDFTKETERNPKIEAEDNWKQFNKLLSAEVSKVVRGEFLKQVI